MANMRTASVVQDVLVRTRQLAQDSPIPHVSDLHVADLLEKYVEEHPDEVPGDVITYLGGLKVAAAVLAKEIYLLMDDPERA